MEACTCVQSTCVVCKSTCGVEENNRILHSPHMDETQRVHNGEKRVSLSSQETMPSSPSTSTSSSSSSSHMEPSANTSKAASAETQTKEQNASSSSSSTQHNTSPTRHGKVALGEICGYTQDGVESYSNGSHNT